MIVCIHCSKTHNALQRCGSFLILRSKRLAMSTPSQESSNRASKTMLFCIVSGSIPMTQPNTPPSLNWRFVISSKNCKRITKERERIVMNHENHQLLSNKHMRG